LSSSGDTMTHGRVFWISLPSVGSSRTKCTSPRETLARATTAIPSCRTVLRLVYRVAGRPQRRASPSRQQPSPPEAFDWPERAGGPARRTARPPRVAAPDRAAPLGRETLASCRCEQCGSWLACNYIVITEPLAGKSCRSGRLTPLFSGRAMPFEARRGAVSRSAATAC